ncbi:MAG: site-2 protease family protein [Candidatus Heimdallarchaeota archaeon]|nr:site-2 protease family protein [Candidatus Heimdallarchaeota archaeon]MCK4954556.1 site-2 protease family protein [Candidatus Heimdallarchaeota archaeon]
MLTKLQIILIVVMAFLFLSTLGNYFDLKRFGIHFFPLGIMFKTDFFNRILEKMGEKGKRFWAFTYNVGKILALIIAIGFFAYFLVNPFLILFGSPAGLGIQLIIPGITVDFKMALLLIIPFLLMIVPHEIAHAVMAKREGIKIKSSGIIILLIFFGAFVELMKESLEAASSRKRIRVLMNGSALNAIFALLFLGLYLLSPYIISIGYGESSGVLITNTFDDFPAEGAGIVNGDIIQSIGKTNKSMQIDYKETRNVNDFTMIILDSLNSSILYIMLLDGRNISLVPTKVDPITKTNSTTKIFLGISIYNYLPPKANWLSKMFPYYWNIEILYIVNLSVAAVFFNLLPLAITDGDKIIQEYLKMKNKNGLKHKRILNIMRLFSLALIVLNLVLSAFKFRWL